MKIVYDLISDIRELEGCPYTAYGIVARTANHQTLLCVQDITSNQKQAESLVNLCNTLHLLPVHLWDVIADFIAA